MLDRRRLILSAAAGGVALVGRRCVPDAPPPRRPTTSSRYANFGAASELLLEGLLRRGYGPAKLYKGAHAGAFTRAGFAASEHVVGSVESAGRVGPDRAARGGLRVRLAGGDVPDAQGCGDRGPDASLDPLLGAYLTAAATSPTQSVRVLFSSLAASLGEQRSTLLLARGRTAIGNSFPAAVDLETASAAVEAYLG